MGDGNRQFGDAAAEAGRGRDPHADRATPASAAPATAEVGVGDERGHIARPSAGAEAAVPDGAGHGDRAEAPAGAGEASTAAEAAPEGLSLDDLEFHALRAIRYHEDRGAFLDLARRILDFLVVALGAGAVTSLFAQSTAWAAALNVATALIGALQLVANLGDKAQEHRWARKKHCELLARVTEAKLEGTPAPRMMRKLTKRWTEIWGDEPTTMHVLEAIAHNATARSLNREIDPDDLIEIPRWESFTRNLLAHESFEHLTLRERREAAMRKAAAASA